MDDGLAQTAQIASELSVTPGLSFWLALLASAGTGLALVLTQFGLRHMQAADGAMISIPMVAALFWILSPFNVDLTEWNAMAIAIFAMVGLFFPAAVTLLTYEANLRMGPTIAGTVGSTTPLFAGCIAIFFLDERVTLITACATLVVVAGIATLSWQSRSSGRRWPARLLLLPLAAAVLRGLAQAMTKMGLAIWPSAFVAGLIGYSMSIASVAVNARLWRVVRQPRFNTKGVGWFILVGLCNGASVLSMYAALNLDDVTFVAPIIATYPISALLFAALILPDQRITLKSAAGTILTVSGVVGLVLYR